MQAVYAQNLLCLLQTQAPWSEKDHFQLKEITQCVQSHDTLESHVLLHNARTADTPHAGVARKRMQACHLPVIA